MIPMWIRSTLLPNWKILLVLLLPLFLLPLPILANTREARAGYVIIIVSLFLVSSVLPLAVTSLLPIALFPLLNVLGTNDVCSTYFKGPNVVFFCSVALALGVEQSALQRRVALRALLSVGVDPKWLMLAFMFLSMFMSMWISNSAVTAMLLPIMRSLVNEIFEEENPSNEDNLSVIEVSTNSNYCSSTSEFAVEYQPSNEKLRSDYKRKVQTAMYLAIPYSCAMGGATTLVGSGALLLKGIIDGMYPNGNSLNFPSYMALTIPIALINLLLTWLWLCFLYIGLRNKGNKKFIKDPASIRSALIREYEALGPMTFHQAGITFLFGLLILLWFFKSPQFMPGWISLIGNRFEIGDATPGIAVVFLAFIIPAKPNWPACLKRRKAENIDDEVNASSTTLLEWNYIQKNFPWNVILLNGSGYALSEASTASGLSNWLGQHLSGLHSLPPIAIMILACLITSSITEIANNSATAAICLPIIIKLAETTGMNPLYLMIPATIHCSYAFMLPVGTPPNAMVLEAGKIEPSHLLRAGIVMNVYCMLVCCVMTVTLGDLIFDWSTIPEWMVPINNTMSLE